MNDNRITEKNTVDNKKTNTAEKSAGTRFLAKGIEVSNNGYATKLNANDCVCGCSGSGKTTSYVYNNIIGKYGSYVIADTKGNLAKRFAPILEADGYDVKTLDFVDVTKSVGYNPLDYIRRNDKGSYSEQDCQKLAKLISPTQIKDDPYWEQSSEHVICGLIALTLETYPREKQNLQTVCELSKMLGFFKKDEDGEFENNSMFRLHNMFCDAYDKNNDSFAYKKYKGFKHLFNAERTWACVIHFTQKMLALFDISAFSKMFTNKNKVDFTKLGKSKTAYFVNVSDCDRSNDPIVNIFYSQLLQSLILEADKMPESRLDIPVRIILDDFCTNSFIPDFDKIISVTRSRNINLSIIIQSITQLNALYGKDCARTIIGNCDHFLYYGSNDYETADYISMMGNMPVDKVLTLPLNKQIIFTRGQKPIVAERADPDAIDFSLPDIKNTESEKHRNTAEKTQRSRKRFPSKQPAHKTADDEIKPVNINDPAYSTEHGTADSYMFGQGIVLNNVSPCLIDKFAVNTKDGSKKELVRFTFCYSFNGNEPVFASIVFDEKYTAEKNGRYQIFLGPSEHRLRYTLSRTDNSGHITASELKDMYEINSRRYREYLRNRNPGRAG